MLPNATTSAIGHRGHSSIPVLRLYHYHDRSYGECVRKAALSMHRIGANGYKDCGHLAGNLHTIRPAPLRADARRRQLDGIPTPQRQVDKPQPQRLCDRPARARRLHEGRVDAHAESVREAIARELG